MSETGKQSSGRGVWRRVRSLVVDGDLPKEPRTLRAAAAFLRLIVLAAVRFERDLGRERAAALAYSTLLALIPLALLAVGIAKGLDVERQEEMTRWVVNLLVPGEADRMRDGILEYFADAQQMLDSTATGTGLRITGGILMVYFFYALVTSVDRMVAAIWGTGTLRDLIGRLTSYWMVFTLGPLLLALSFGGTAMAGQWLGEGAGNVFRSLVPFAITWVSVFLFYRLMPHGKVRWEAALTGAVVAGSLWEISKIVLGAYFAQARTLLAGMAAFPLVLLWLYVSWLIAIYGLEVAYVVHHGEWKPGRRTAGQAEHGRARDVLILAVALEVVRAFDRGVAPDREEIGDAIGAADDDVAAAIAALEDADLVARHEAGGFRPARGASGISALDVLDASRGAVPPGMLASTSTAVREAHAVLESVGERGIDAARGVTLAEIVARDA